MEAGGPVSWVWLEDLLGGKHPDDVVVCGGAMLQMRGLREHTNDVDLIVGERAAEQLQAGQAWREHGIPEGRYLLNTTGPMDVSAATLVRWGWSQRPWDLNAVFDGSEVFDGWRIQSVVQLYEWKRLTVLSGGNPKHLRDMGPMAQYLVHEADLLSR